MAGTADFLAFLDINPLKRGHLLVIPKQEVDYIFDLPSDLYLGLHAFARELAVALKQAVPCARIGMAVVGLEVPHAHIHLVPIDSISDLNFAKPKVKLTAEEMEETARSIRQELLIE
ncbi:MAG: HIT family protein [Bacteroidota bacterium]